MDDYSDAPSLPANAVTAADEIDLPGILAELGPEVADIVETCLAGGNPTQAQRDRANQGIDRKIDETFDAAKENAKEKLRIKPNDSRSRIIAITQIAASFLNFLGRLCSWIIGKVRWIISKIAQGIQWCVQKTKSFFRGVWSWLRR